MKPEPILDVVRGISTVASFGIVARHVVGLFRSMYVSSCYRCRGTGVLTCPHCHGTATLLRRPGVLLVRTLSVGNSYSETYPCGFCGHRCLADLGNGAGESAQDKAAELHKNLRAAMANSYPLPHPQPAYAGTVDCEMCGGNGMVARFTPNVSSVLGMHRPWQESIARRLGRLHVFSWNRPPDRQRLYLEYPRVPQPDAHFPWTKSPKRRRTEFARLWARKKDPGVSRQFGPLDVTITSKPQLKNFMLPFIDEPKKGAQKEPRE